VWSLENIALQRKGAGDDRSWGAASLGAAGHLDENPSVSPFGSRDVSFQATSNRNRTYPSANTSNRYIINSLTI
jgi:hypothetical protein